MCDTFIIKRKNGQFFLKNSDRSPNEPNLLVYIPRQQHKDNVLHCTYIDIQQVKETYECFLVKPSWMYGAEMGINEFNLAIGNEAVFTKHHNKKESLIGMDYLRLALERCKTAKEAKNFIIKMLQKYDQGGNCGYDHEFYYNNSYLISDPKETYILETVGKEYAVYKTEDSYNISNRLSISNNITESSKTYKNFKKENSDFFFTTFSMSKERECKGQELIKEAKEMKDFIATLSSHRLNNNIDLKGDTGSICMHKNLVGDHTTGSMIVDLSQTNPTIWVSGGTSPCVSIFKPYYLGCKNPFVKNNDQDRLNYFLDRMYLNRIVFSNLVDKKEYHNKKDEIQNYLIKKEQELRNKNSSQKDFFKFSEEANKLEQEFVESYRDKIEEAKKNPNILKGIWKNITKKQIKNYFSNNLKDRLDY